MHFSTVTVNTVAASIVNIFVARPVIFFNFGKGFLSGVIGKNARCDAKIGNFDKNNTAEEVGGQKIIILNL